MQKKHAIAFAAVMMCATLAPNAQAMSLGSLSRQHSVAQTDEIVTNSIPREPQVQVVQPKFQLIFFTIGSFLREHFPYALAEAHRGEVQPITFASR